jgi:UDP-N-acetylmuramyl pentapeptide synthase
MAELGDDENHWHRVIGQYAKESGITSLLCVGNLTQYACQGFGEGAKHYESKTALIDDLVQQLHDDCAVLVKGSFSMAMGEVVTAIENNKEGRSH